MYLEKLEIQGFKSFAKKNTLVFPGKTNGHQGITTIVGPNGSGKSNIADAVRWALGEQSMKTLRGKKGDDIIFSGSDKKGRLGMAEVSLFLNNEDRKADIDYSQIVLTRRLYRDGNSEYLINNNKVRLIDVQIMLAKASFGQKTYSVIGQGLVEGFLNTSLAERKEFFDEATGVRQYQIKRDDSLNKLKNSLENLNQAEMLMVEIEPRLKSLTRQASKLEKREDVETELNELQLSYYRQTWHGINDRLKVVNLKFLEIERNKLTSDKKIESLNKELGNIEKEKSVNQEFEELQGELANLQNKRNELVKELNKLEAWLEVKLESSGQFDLSFLNSRQSELNQEESTIKQELSSLQTVVKEVEDKIVGLNNEKEGVNGQISKLNEDILRISDKGGDIDISSKLKNSLIKLEQAGQENDLDKIKQIIQEIRREIKDIISSGDHSGQISEVQKKILNFTKQKEGLIDKIGGHNLQLSVSKEKLRTLSNRQNQINNELKTVNDKLERSKVNSTDSGDEKENKIKREEAVNKIADLDEKIDEIRQKIGRFSEEQESRREYLFSVQRKSQTLQSETNQLNDELNNIKIEATRHETRLETLELEIRQNLGDLAKVKEKRSETEVNETETMERLSFLRRQLDMIGGIDPSVAKEYIETKERYDFLDKQVNDLNNTIRSLESIIKELDITIKEKFDKEFKIISAKFEEYFKILFNGGVAKVKKVLVDDDERERIEQTEGANNLESNLKRIKFLQKYNSTGLAGIEIIANPPGKKITSVSMLSGGERALTAIALICAIISANPSPFVVLDEVDAALDEANSERLGKILDDLSSKTQFIVVTHNRAVMRRSSILYGVTMQDDGVSKLLSVKLEDLKQ